MLEGESISIKHAHRGRSEKQENFEAHFRGGPSLLFFLFFRTIFLVSSAFFISANYRGNY